MLVYALIIEAHSDDDRLIGIYSSVDAAREAYGFWEDRCYYPFYRIEERLVDAGAREYAEELVVYESHTAEEED